MVGYAGIVSLINKAFSR